MLRRQKNYYIRNLAYNTSKDTTRYLHLLIACASCFTRMFLTWIIVLFSQMIPTAMKIYMLPRLLYNKHREALMTGLCSLTAIFPKFWIYWHEQRV